MVVQLSHANAASSKQQVLKQTQGKAQELLQTLDAARRQKTNNEKVKNHCLDNEEVMLKMHQNTFAQKQQREILRALQKSSELLTDYESDVSYTQLRKFNVERYMVDCGQEMPIREMTKPEDEPNCVHIEEVVDEMRRLKGQGQNAAAFDGYIDFSLRQLEKVIALFAESKLNSQPWARAVNPLQVLLRDVMHQTPIKDSLIEAEETVKRMRFSIDECSEAQAQAIADGEMDLAENLYYTKIELQEKLSDLIKQKFGVLDQEEVTAFKIPIKRVHEVHNQSNMDISELLKGNERQKIKAQTDHDRLLTEVEKVNQEDYNTTRAFNEAREESNRVLTENLKQQQECWGKIGELERQLIQMGQNRFEEVKRRIKAVDREAKRKVEYTHFIEFAKQHQALLELTIRNCELHEEITDSIEEKISNGCNTIERRLREIEKEIQEERVAIHEEYFSSFRTMYLTIGDLQYKKEKKMEELEKRIGTAHMQQEYFMETFNPKAKEAAKEKKDLEAHRKEMENAVHGLREKSVQYIEWFQPSEKALVEAGRTFKHPVEELSEINKSRVNKLIEYQELMAQQDDQEEEYAQQIAEIEAQRSATHSEVARIMGDTGSTSHARLGASLSGPDPEPALAQKKFTSNMDGIE